MEDDKSVLNDDLFFKAGELSVRLKPSRRKKVRKVKVEVEGDLSITYLKQLYAKIPEIFELYDLVDFKLQEVVQLDLPFIQFLQHLKLSKGKEGKEITVHAELPDTYRKLVILAGFESLIFKKLNI